MTHLPRLIVSLAMLTAAIGLVIAARGLDSPDYSAASGFSSMGQTGVSPDFTAGTVTPTTTPTPGLSSEDKIATIHAEIPTPEPTTAARPTAPPKPTCPPYGTATGPGLCFTERPTATAAPTSPPKPAPTFAPCLPTPVPGQWCRYGDPTPLPR